MNSLEAIIALSALSACCAVLLGAITLQKEDFQKAIDQITAKTDSQNCSAVIDSIISNSATGYNGEINCTANKSMVKSKVNNETKQSEIIGTTASESTLSVNIYEHYK